MNFASSTMSAQAQPAAGSSNPPDSVQSATPQQGVHTERIRVLLVDDHALVRAGIRALIEMIEAVDVVGEGTDGAHPPVDAHRQ